MEKHPETFYHYRDCWYKSFYLDTGFLRAADCRGRSAALTVGCISKLALPDCSVNWGLGFPSEICSPELLLPFAVKWSLGSICWAYKQLKASSLVFSCTKTLDLLILIWPSDRIEWKALVNFFPLLPCNLHQLIFWNSDSIPWELFSSFY